MKTSTTFVDYFTPFWLYINSIKNVTFLCFLPLKNPLLATFNETCAFTSRNNVVKQGLNVLKSSEKHKLIELLRFP